MTAIQVSSPSSSPANRAGIDFWTWEQLENETARIAAGLRRLGVGRGDRVAAYLTNTPETVAAFLACASLGATWSAAPPEFGGRTVIDRFAQIEPKVLLALDGYRTAAETSIVVTSSPSFARRSPASSTLSRTSNSVSARAPGSIPGVS